MDIISQQKTTSGQVKWTLDHPFFKTEKPDPVFRSIYEKSILQLQATPHPVVGVFSSIPREGCTSIVLKLAQMASQNQKTVLIIDTGNGGELSRYFNLSGHRGIHDIRDKPSNIADMAIPTKWQGVSVLPFGLAANTGLPYQDLKPAIAELKPQWDLTLIDLPPILESLLAAHLSDGVVDKLLWVIAAHRTRRETILRAQAELRTYGQPIPLETILNMRQFFIPKGLYRFF